MWLTPEKKTFGYTIVEVMIVLAIAGMLVTSAVVLFRGTGQRTQFEQAINDFNSKLQSAVKGVSDELSPSSSEYVCQYGQQGPILTKPAGGGQAQNTNQDCVFLGKLFQVTPNQGQMKVYNVIGNRLCTGTVNGCLYNQLATTFTFTLPTIANFAYSGGNLNNNVLTETYNLTDSNAVLRYAHANGAQAEADFAGFYNGIGTDAQAVATNGSLNLLAKSYGYDSRSFDQNTLESCVRTDTGCASTGLSSWQLCFAHPGNADLTGLVTLNVTSNGIQSTVKLKGC